MADAREAAGARVAAAELPRSAERPAEAGPLPPPGLRLRLFLLSFLMLFVELALIRWLGANIVYLSYFSNFVLLGSFLGIGIGFLRARARVHLFPWAPVALAFLIVFVRIFPVEIDRSGGELIYFGSFRQTGLPLWITLPLVFGAVAGVMAMIAEGVARTFARFEPLEAYRLDILGSIAGIVGFSVLAFFHAPPLAWGLVAAAAFGLLLGRRVTLLQAASLVAIVAVLLLGSYRGSDVWSPYYRISVNDEGAAGRDPSGRIDISVNGVPHQTIVGMERRLETEPIYGTPYERAPGNALENVLVVGAGNGSDVAIALARGAARVDAVEIDPRLYEIGRDRHPDRPYQDPRVEVHIDDGRAFLERSDERYDMIVFALPDSITLVSGQSSLRLESYLFTVEAMREAREHLRPGGVFTMYNYYRERWLVDRLASTLREVYGHPPCIDSVGHTGYLAALTVGLGPGDTACEAVWEEPAAGAPVPVADDRPFLYLRGGIPPFYLLTLALILVASIVAVRGAAGRLRSMAPYLDLGLMGVAFLLLETKNVVQFALLFGTTWFVNALVFTGILLFVYAAIEVARRFRLPPARFLYLALLAAVAVAWAVPTHTLLTLPVVPRFLAATALAFTPVFLANLIFAQRFRDVGSSTVAFGANLLGAMVGGLVEYGALAVGYRSLLILVALLYGLAYLATPRRVAART